MSDDYAAVAALQQTVESTGEIAMMKCVRAAAVALSLVTLQSFAQGYPVKPVHLIISFIPGSSTDIVGRIVFQKVSEYWGQPVVPDNRAGAGGAIGTAAVVN